MFSGNADWYVLDENLNRRVRLEEEMLEEISAAMEANEDQYVEIEEGNIYRAGWLAKEGLVLGLAHWVTHTFVFIPQLFPSFLNRSCICVLHIRKRDDAINFDINNTRINRLNVNMHASIMTQGCAIQNNV